MAMFTVTTLADSGPGSLREAIQLANMSVGPDTINFQAGLTGTISLQSSLPTISDDLVIIGPGQADLIIDGGPADFQIIGITAGVTVRFEEITLRAGGGMTVASGGAISNSGTLELVNVTLAENQAMAGGAISNSGTLTITGCTLTANTATQGSGGAIDTQDVNVTIQDSVLSGNEASLTGGAIAKAEGMSGLLLIQNSTISGNSAGQQGGGLFVRGPVQIEDSLLERNSSANGGGIEYGGATLEILNSTLAGNTALNDGGGLFVTNGTANIRNSTFDHNTAALGGGGLNQLGGTTSLVNVTLSQNTAQVTGAAIVVRIGTVQVSFATIAQNVVLDITGAAIDVLGGSLSIKNSIVTSTTNGMGLPRFDCMGPISGPVGNIATSTNCALFTFVTEAELNLGPLLLNAPGTTKTHALLTGSAAIDFVQDCTDVLGNPVTTDQRGVMRPQGARCDAGAFEAVQAVTTTTTTTTPPPKGLRWPYGDAVRSL